MRWAGIGARYVRNHPTLQPRLRLLFSLSGSRNTGMLPSMKLMKRQHAFPDPLFTLLLLLLNALTAAVCPHCTPASGLPPAQAPAPPPYKARTAGAPVQARPWAPSPALQRFSCLAQDFSLASPRSGGGPLTSLTSELLGSATFKLDRCHDRHHATIFSHTTLRIGFCKRWLRPFSTSINFKKELSAIEQCKFGTPSDDLTRLLFPGSRFSPK
ncbi:hypothetical protein EDB86DRAFT_1288655 [Lactarius hatsudake]|nr:hypothetical protein EDB86DRAFT_1288655 [Lactarius hatsudake]